MAIRKIARMGHPVLRQKARELSKAEILSPQMKILIQDMIDTMNDYTGIGLAAPQIYESVSVAIVDYQGDNPRYATESNPTEKLPFTVIINPKITVLDKEEQQYWEGCLSVPDLRGLVARPKKIKVDFLNLKAEPQSVTVEGFLATVFQHEIDHLNGIIYVDRVKREIGKTTLAFTEEYERFLVPHEDDDVGELPE